MRIAFIGLVTVALVWGCGQRGWEGPEDGGEEAPALRTIDAGWTGELPDSGGVIVPEPSPDGGWDAGTTAIDVPEPDALGCPGIFSQELLPTYRVEVSPSEWAALEDEFLNRAQRKDAGLDENPWHPVVFRFNGEVYTDAMIRLKGQSSWQLTVERDPNPKMQFVISFNERDPEARFYGVRKLVLDMPRNDKTFLRQRLGLSFVREDLLIPAQCANNATLYINDQYYGLYAQLENLDKEFLQRNFGTDDEGDLWKSGDELKTNEETSTRLRRSALFSAKTVGEIENLTDLEASVFEWAAEAMMPHADGYYAGTANYYLYDHPGRGFLWLPYDLDAVFDFAAPDVDPIFWKFNPEPARHWWIVLGNSTWRSRYIDSLRQARGRFDVGALQGRLAKWSAQISQAAAQDPHRPFTFDEHQRAVNAMSAFLPARASYIDQWLDCRGSGGGDPDQDGTAWCFDCREGDPNAFPGAQEICNAVDDDCDGYADDQCIQPAVDAGTPDAGTPDVGVPDAGTRDAGTADAGVLDAGTRDAGTFDAGAPDAGTPDAGTPDAGTPDAGTPDAGTRDAGTLDAGATEPEPEPDAGAAELDAGAPDPEQDGGAE